MSDLNHPADGTLALLAAGGLAHGPRLVVASHVETCARCARRVSAFEAVGGALLEDLPPAAMPADGLARALAALDLPAPAKGAAAPPARPELPTGLALPSALDDCDFGPWRWVAPGIRISRARNAWARASGLKMYRLDPGRRLPRHGHMGTEWTCVLSGSFADERARYVAGDIVEVDQHVDHQPVVDDDAPCFCLVAMDGRMRLNTFVGKLHQMIFDA